MALQEYWTSSGRALVVTAEPAEIQRLADRLGMPEEEIIEVTQNRAALTLWGESLHRYQREKSHDKSEHRNRFGSNCDGEHQTNA